MRYKLYAQGPDDYSTYAECWGATRSSPGRLMAEASRLAGLIEAVEGMGHANWTIRDSCRHEDISPEEFERRPTILAALKKPPIE